MYCTYCGRRQLNKCICLHANPASRLEGFLILIVFQGMLLVLLALNTHLITFNNYELLLKIGFFLGASSVVLSAITMVSNKSYLALFFGCHQSSNRSLKINQKELNICSRCTGIYIGFFLSIVFFYIETPIFIIVLMSLPLVFDGLSQKYTGYTSNNARRLLSGLLFSPFLVVIFTYFYVAIISLIQWFYN